MTFLIFDVYCQMVAEIQCYQSSDEERREYAEATGRRLLGDRFLCAEKWGDA